MTDQALDDLLRQVLLDAEVQEYGDMMELLPEHDFSPDFERRMKKLIRRADHPIRHRVAKVAACLLLAVLLSGCTVLAISPEARAAVVGWVRETYESWFVYRYSGEEQPTLENTVYSPTWVPDGYEEIAAPQVGTFVRTQYENGAKKLLTVSYMKGTETSSLNVEWEGATIRRTLVGHLSADLYLNPDDGSNILVWTDTEKDAAFWITAPLGEEELVKVAESIQESEPMPRRYCVSWLPQGAYGILSETEGPGRNEIVYENSSENYSVTFGYSNAASASRPDMESYPVYVGGREGRMYLADRDNGDKTLIWTAEDGTVLWVRAPLPDEELLLIAENVIVQLNRFTDLIEIQTADKMEAPMPEAVEHALTETYVAQVEDCARRAAESGSYASEEYNQLLNDQLARYISPEREEALARISALANTLRQEGRFGENIVSLFGPFYTASIYVSWYDDDAYALLTEYGMADMLEHYCDTRAHIIDERGVMIASYQINHFSGRGETITVPTAEEMRFSYESNQIYLKAYRSAQAEETRK